MTTNAESYGQGSVDSMIWSSDSLLAPRPIKPVRTQTSIISLENFFGITGFNDLTKSQPIPTSSISSSSSGSDIIPFPQITSTPVRSLQLNSPRQSMIMPAINSALNSPVLTSSVGPSGMRSRRSSLLDSWELQNIRVSGNKLVGETEVPMYIRPEDDLALSTRESSLSSSITSSVSSSNKDEPEFQPIQLYGSRPDSVDELFHIMKYTSLSGSPSKPVSYLDPDPVYPSTDSRYPIPPSPVARHTRNPIILNSAFNHNTDHTFDFN